MKKVLALALAAGVGGLTALSCGGSSNSSPPPFSARLDAAFELAGRQANITSLVVARDGAIVREQYWNGGGADIPQDVRSVTKSVMSLLVGAAVDRGCLHSIDQTVGELFGPLGPSDPVRAAVTVRQVLSMSSGLGRNELSDVQEYNRFILAEDHLAYVWSELPANPPGAFTYSSAVFFVLSPLVARACAQTTSDFARDALLGPLGIGPRDWETVPPENVANGAAGLTLTPHDMVAIGNLVLEQGRAGGRQVVSAAWVRDATEMQVVTYVQPPATGYGFGWWTGRTGAWDYAFANGWGGQFIVVVPTPRLVVTATCRWQGVGTATAQSQWGAVMNIIMQNIVPACEGAGTP